jgi:hypothetical protein
MLFKKTGGGGIRTQESSLSEGKPIQQVIYHIDRLGLAQQGLQKLFVISLSALKECATFSDTTGQCRIIR